jgi:hypothetical protein
MKARVPLFKLLITYASSVAKVAVEVRMLIARSGFAPGIKDDCLMRKKCIRQLSAYRNRSLPRCV